MVQRKKPSGARVRQQRRLIVTGFSVATIVLVALLCLAYWSNTRFVQWNGLVLHTREVQSALEDYAGKAMKKCAAHAAVNFYTDGNEQQVAAFAAARTQAHNALDHARALTPDNLTQQNNLDTLMPLSDQGLDLLAQLFMLRREGKTGDRRNGQCAGRGEKNLAAAGSRATRDDLGGE